MKKRENQIKAIIFDIGGVLELGKTPMTKIKGKWHHKGLHESVANKLKISLDQYFDSIDTTYAMSMEGQISENEVIRIISQNFEISEKKLTKIYKQAFKKNFKTNKQLYKLAFKLQKNHKIAILSDQWHLSKKALIKPKYMKKFNSVVISCDVGLRKPNPKIYKLIRKKLNIPFKNCLFIDNQKWNLEPAKKLGMQTILFKNNKQLSKQLLRCLK